ncbi:hypothetical protein J8273_2242 [Carpediemonas membranifera]|uniref:Uncharacterized protein n=1 Tax=Carpediemonas membranifera TaxID=201153 RepID=A0A8J6E3R5_9EUKA|nr:hypothetical protein J8273_2242 [Carpediemonas membranifera]|eukprot:KAG9395906.1 hypothetical protein J8273_2242 [Carpediemonas membranifera]
MANANEELIAKIDKQDKLIKALTARMAEQEENQEDLREPKRLDGVIKEYRAWKQFFADFKADIKGRTEKPSVGDVFDTAKAMIDKRLEYLRTVDTFGDAVAAVYLVEAEGLTGKKDFARAAMKAAKNLNARPITKRPHGGSSKFCTVCRRRGHSAHECWRSQSSNQK